MYENGGSSALELLLSSESLAEFLNRAESVAQISQYDRDMLQKYENLQKSIQENEETIEKESANINNLMTERASKQQEVQAMAASTSDNINSYVSQISASQAEADQLMSEITSADNNITALVQQAEAERAAEEKAAAEAAAAKERSKAAASEDSDNGDSEAAQDSSSDDTAEASETDTVSQSDTEDTYSEEDYGYDPEEDTTESSSSSTSSEVTVEEEDEEEDSVPSAGAEDTSESDYTEESASEDVTEDVAEDTTEDTAEDTTESDAEESTSTESSGQGKYLGNFTLTAYCNCAQCCGTAGNLTASGTVPTAGRTVAMAGVPFGTQLLINGNVYTVEDLGTPYGHVDIYCGSHEEALSFGLQSAEVYQLN